MNSWNYQISSGYNKILLPTTTAVYKGSFIILNQVTGRIALDQTANASVSDLVWRTSLWSNIDTNNSNTRFYFNVIKNVNYYQSSFTAVYKYASLGSYSIIVSLGKFTLKSNIIVTDRKFFFVKNYKNFQSNINYILKVKILDLIKINSANSYDKTVNLLYYLYTSVKTDTLIIDYGNGVQKTSTLNSSLN